MATTKQILEQAEMLKMNNMRSLVTKANIDPRSLTQKELETATQYAQQMGMDTSSAKSRDVATETEKWKAGIIGGIDAMLFGAIPDSIYSNYRTKKYADRGKMAGNIASLLIPGAGVLGAFKGAKGIVAATKGLYSLDKVKDAAELGKILVNVKKATGATGNVGAIVEMAKALLRSGSAITSGLQGFSEGGQQSPYDQQFGIAGMPPQQ